MSINVSEIKEARRRIGAAPHQQLLDVATASGNVAIPAAQRGGA